MNGGVYRRRHSGLCAQGKFVSLKEVNKDTDIVITCYVLDSILNSFFFYCATSTGSYLWILECHVNSKTWSKACQSLEVGGVGQRPTTLSEHGEGQRFEMLAVDVTLPTVHRLQQILAGDDLTRTKQQLYLVWLENTAFHNTNLRCCLMYVNITRPFCSVLGMKNNLQMNLEIKKKKIHFPFHLFDLLWCFSTWTLDP